MSGHDRRPKEAAQLGAYHVMLRGRNPGAYFIDDRGQRRTLTEQLRMGIVTFCPDGTWAMHEVHTDEAEKAYELALAMRHQSKVSTLYKGRATKSDMDPEFVARLNGELMDAIMRIPADARELAMLMEAWQARGLPRASEGKVPPERYGEAMALIFRYGAAWQPFPEGPPPEPLCPQDAQHQLIERWSALPSDLRDRVATQGAHLPNLLRPVLTQAEAEDWHRLLKVAEMDAACRVNEATNLIKFIRDLDCAELVLSLIEGFGGVDRWTERDLTLIAALWDACSQGHVGAVDGVLTVDGEVAAGVTALMFGGKRQAVAEAKRLAEKYGLHPRPSKWDDLLGHPVLYAAVVAA